MEKEFRLFIAAELPASCFKPLTLAMQRLQREARRASLTRPENLHLTLRFIGEQKAAKAELIRQAFSRLMSGEGKAPQLEWTGFGSFSGRDGATVYAAFKADDVLLNLQRQIEETLAEMGLAPEKKSFKPHVTLARRALFDERPDFSAWPKRSGSLTVPSVHLLLSEFTGRGMRYTKLESKYY